jgi:hypothetical protein
MRRELTPALTCRCLAASQGAAHLGAVRLCWRGRLNIWGATEADRHGMAGLALSDHWPYNAVRGKTKISARSTPKHCGVQDGNLTAR